ncbi:MAG: hypothetical protein DI551_03790 [Micavibrio aeruginosavorus]|uniref:Uncharacterized protein n=1 Tax=Micavibrio aeruginosavorus TaxID=349221 RepID=A0A2W5N118_9BACT|nr:MAG: hypothetical protein DI551_03790 [Micavibrio aeruginosavorus]
MSENTPSKPFLSVVQPFNLEDCNYVCSIDFEYPDDANERNMGLHDIRRNLAWARLTNYRLLEDDLAATIYFTAKDDVVRFGVAAASGQSPVAVFFDAPPKTGMVKLRNRTKKLQLAADELGFTDKITFATDEDNIRITIHAKDKKAYFDFMDASEKLSLKESVFRDIEEYDCDDTAEDIICETAALSTDTNEAPAAPQKPIRKKAEINLEKGIIDGSGSVDVYGPRLQARLSLAHSFNADDYPHSMTCTLHPYNLHDFDESQEDNVAAAYQDMSTTLQHHMWRKDVAAATKTLGIQNYRFDAAGTDLKASFQTQDDLDAVREAIRHPPKAPRPEREINTSMDRLGVFTSNAAPQRSQADLKEVEHVSRARYGYGKDVNLNTDDSTTRTAQKLKIKEKLKLIAAKDYKVLDTEAGFSVLFTNVMDHYHFGLAMTANPEKSLKQRIYLPGEKGKYASEIWKLKRSFTLAAKSIGLSKEVRATPDKDKGAIIVASASLNEYFAVWRNLSVRGRRILKVSL